jgi:glycosyltransferase involved in cell wall biosynthesis
VTPLRIAMLTTFFPPYSFGGDAFGVERLATALSRRGHEVTVVHDIDAYATLAGEEPSASSPPRHFEVIGLRSRVGILSSLLTHQTSYPIIHRAKLKSLLRPGAFDIIWFHNVSLIGGLGLLSFGDGLKVYEAHEHWLVCPTHVLWRHNRELCDARQCFRCGLSYRRPPQLWRRLAFVDRQLGQVDLFIAKSAFSRRKHGEFGFTRDMTVVPYFLPDKPIQNIAEAQMPHSRPYFLFVGRLEKIKGLDDVIPVFSDHIDADLLIIGTGEYEPELKKRAKGIPNVKFVGRLAPDELSKYYRSAIALIVPSVCFETFGIILIESFREGTPVIARDIGPFREIVEQSNGGILFKDADELKAAMHSLQSNPTRRFQMAEAARIGFETLWREEIVMKRYYDSLRQAALSKGLPRLAAALEE